MSKIEETFYLLFLILLAQNRVQTSSCDTQNVCENRQVKLGNFVEIGHVLNIADDSNYSDTFDVLFEACERKQVTTLCTFRWRRPMNKLNVLNWTSDNKSACFVKRRNISNTLQFEIQISQQMRPSLSLAKLTITDNKDTFEILRIICLKVLQPPKVTNLTVDDTEVTGDYFIEEGQEVSVLCVFDKGNPPTLFSLLDKNGKLLTQASDEGKISHSLTVQCEDDWPVIRCEGAGSECNRSVSFLVKCSPQFLDVSPKVSSRAASISWIFMIKAHTKVIEKCLLTTVTSGRKSSREVNCTLEGHPPDLLLTVSLDKINTEETQQWTLTVRNEMGFSRTSSGFNQALGKYYLVLTYTSCSISDVFLNKYLAHMWMYVNSLYALLWRNFIHHIITLLTMLLILEKRTVLVLSCL